MTDWKILAFSPISQFFNSLAQKSCSFLKSSGRFYCHSTLWVYSAILLPFSALSLSAACPVGYFKPVSGSVPCTVCPPNSRTSQEGSSVCECRSGFYRAANDANSSACTSELCVLICLCLALRDICRAPQWSRSSLTQTMRTEIQSLNKIHFLKWKI